MAIVRPQPQNVYPKLRDGFVGATFVYLPSVALLRSREFPGSIGGGTPVLQQPISLFNSRSARIDNNTYIAMGATSRDRAFPDGMTILAVGAYSTASGICSITARGSGGSPGGWMVSLRNQFAGTPAGIYSSHYKTGTGDSAFESCWVNGAKDAGNGNGVGSVIYGTAVNTRYAVVLATTQATAVSTSDDISIGHNLSYDQSTNIEFVIIWPRRLTEQQMRLLSIDPYAVFQPREREELQYVNVSGNAYTLTADSGTFALTGTAAALKFGHKVTAASGSFALTGTAALLKRGYPLTAASGSFTLTGTAAGLRAQRKITAAAGSFTLTGTAAALKYGRKLTAAGGSFTFTGTAAGLYRGYPMAANVGAFALTGTAASLKYGHKVGAESGSFVLTGQSVTLNYGKTIAAAAGSFTLTGVAASLKYGRRLSAASGTFVFTGQDAALSKSGAFTLAAGAGSFALSGNVATLLAARKLTASGGSFALTGVDVALRKGISMLAGGGSFTLTGQDAAMPRAYRLTAALGSFAFTGSDVTLTYSAAPPPAVLGGWTSNRNNLQSRTRSNVQTRVR